MCANIGPKLFRPDIFLKLLKRLSIQSSCLQEKFALTVEGDDERGARETIYHSWASRGVGSMAFLSLSGLKVQHTYLITHSCTHSLYAMYTLT